MDGRERSMPGWGHVLHGGHARPGLPGPWPYRSQARPCSALRTSSRGSALRRMPWSTPTAACRRPWWPGTLPLPHPFYCIDSHIHSVPALRRSFDLCAVSLRDHVEPSPAPLGRTAWPGCRPLPPAPRPRQRTRNSICSSWARWTRIQRRCAGLPLAPGQAGAGLAVRQGSFPELKPRARVVLNIAERGDLNFRVFEALACGAC